MFDSNIETIDGISLLYLQGILTRDTIAEFESICSQVVNNEPEVIALNFKDVRHIDSVSINHLFKLAKKAQEKEIQLIIYDMEEPIQQILEMIKLDRVIVFMTREKFFEEFLKISNR